VTSVITLDLLLFHGFEDVEGELLSSAEMVDGEDGKIGAERKWKPLGVGKWSLSGDNQASILRFDVWLRSCLLSMAYCVSSLSSSIIVLSDLPSLLACEGEGGLYVDEGK